MDVEPMHLQLDDGGLGGVSTFPTLDSLAGDTPGVDDHQVPSRPYSPLPVVGSVEDVQAYFTDVALHDASGYNTEYEEPVDGEHDGSSVGGDVGIDEELARLA